MRYRCILLRGSFQQRETLQGKLLVRVGLGRQAPLASGGPTHGRSISKCMCSVASLEFQQMSDVRLELRWTIRYFLDLAAKLGKGFQWIQQVTRVLEKHFLTTAQSVVALPPISSSPCGILMGLRPPNPSGQPSGTKLTNPGTLGQ